MKSKSPRLPKHLRNGAKRITNKNGERVWVLNGWEYKTLRDVAYSLAKTTQKVHPFI